MDKEPTYTQEEQDYLAAQGLEIEANSQTTSTKTSDENAIDPTSASENKNENEPKRNRMVPHAALHEERSERKKAQSEAAMAKAALARLEERFRLAQSLNFSSTSAESPPENRNRDFTVTSQNSTSISDPMPDPEQDFFGYTKWMGRQLAEQRRLTAENLAQQQAQQQAESLSAYFQQSVTEAKNQWPDFDEAANFLYHQRSQQLAALGSAYPRFQDQNQIDYHIAQELKDLINEAAHNAINPAQLLYDFAIRAGYKGSSQNHQNDKVLEDREDSTLAHFEARHNAAKTLSSLNGAPALEPLSLEALDRMSDNEFALWISDPRNEKIFQKLMGG
ncbi:hypothetical protein [Bartonella sp. DGB2]|uniref:hypothetical protein n=1 Tax=Bartonella sp. DGB2 TaxID=3388426 RepID=UPI00398FA32C